MKLILDYVMAAYYITSIEKYIVSVCTVLVLLLRQSIIRFSIGNI